MPPKTQSIFLGAVVYIFISLLLQFTGSAMQDGGGGAMVIAGISCIATLLLGMVPVWHYTSTNELRIPAGTGAGMGAASLVLGSLVVAVVAYLLVSMGVLPDPQAATLDQMEAQGATQEQIDMALRFSSPLIIAVMGVVFGAVLGAIGGAIGAAVFKKGAADERPEPYA